MTFLNDFGEMALLQTFPFCAVLDVDVGSRFQVRSVEDSIPKASPQFSLDTSQTSRHIAFMIQLQRKFWFRAMYSLRKTFFHLIKRFQGEDSLIALPRWCVLSKASQFLSLSSQTRRNMYKLRRNCKFRNLKRQVVPRLNFRRLQLEIMGVALWTTLALVYRRHLRLLCPALIHLTCLICCKMMTLRRLFREVPSAKSNQTRHLTTRHVFCRHVKTACR